MAGYGEPAWTSAPGTGATSTPNVSPETFTSVSSGMQQDTGLTPGQIKAEKSHLTQIFLSILNIVVCGLMIFLGVMGILAMTFGASLDGLSEFFVTVYMFVFSGLLLVYELMWWKSIGPINKLWRTNFGFLYGMRGKAGYLIFVAFLCLGLDSMEDLQILMYATGSVWLLSGVLHIFVSFWRPHLVENYEAPTAGWNIENGPV